MLQIQVINNNKISWFFINQKPIATFKNLQPVKNNNQANPIPIYKKF